MRKQAWRAVGLIFTLAALFFIVQAVDARPRGNPYSCCWHNEASD
jgi:hypothetical protein